MSVLPNAYSSSANRMSMFFSIIRSNIFTNQGYGVCHDVCFFYINNERVKQGWATTISSMHEIKKEIEAEMNVVAQFSDS